MKKRLLHYTLVALLLLIGLPMSTQRARAATYTVTNTNDSGSGSLRQAIIDANGSPGADTIAFNIPASDPGYSSLYGVWTILLSSSLPALTDGNTIIDGATQTANQGDTNLLGPEVQIDGWYLGAGMPAFLVASDWNQILGLAINWTYYCAVQIQPGTVGNRVKDSYIGIGPDGSYDASNGAGIIIVAARENIIANNVISWNDQYGILITGAGADDNMIRRNTIGLNPMGTAKAPNGSHGVVIAGGAENNTVGGDPGYRNTISGNTGHGVYISGSGIAWNDVSYNYIGVDPAGTGFHDVGNGGSGVAIESGVQQTSIEYNVISGNGEHGVLLSGSHTTHLEHNTIGADAQITALVPNGKHGVGIYDGSSHYIQYNVIVGSGWSGVAIVNSNYNFMCCNNIGTDKDHWSGAVGTDLGNNYYGVHVVDSVDNDIESNHIAYNGALPGRAGVRVEGASATGNHITTNSIHDNSGKGIELVGGANSGLPAPTITQASCQQVQGVTCAGCHVEIFSDGTDEGRIFQNWVIADDTTGAFSWSGQIQGPNVTATASDLLLGNTSEFSAPVNACNKVWVPLVMRD